MGHLQSTVSCCSTCLSTSCRTTRLVTTTALVSVHPQSLTETSQESAVSRGNAHTCHVPHVSSHTQMFHHHTSTSKLQFSSFRTFVWTNKTPMTFISNYF